MKRTLKLLMVVVAMAFSTAVSAQKIGSVLSQEVFLLMPEADSVQIKIQNHAKMLQDDLEQMQVELNTKFEEYQQKKSTYSVAIDQQKQKELNDFNTRINEFAQTAQREVESVRVSLTQPLYLKMGDAIDKVSKEQGLLMVIDLTQNSNIVYVDEASTVDITPLVKTELGIAADAKLPSMQQPVQ